MEERITKPWVAGKFAEIIDYIVLCKDRDIANKFGTVCCPFYRFS